MIRFNQFIAHLCELLPSLGVRRPSVNFFKNLLLWNHRANLSQTWPESSLGGSLWKLCPIKQFWPFEEISIFSNDSHLGWRAWLSDIIFKGNPLRMIQAKFGLNWPGGFRGEDFWKSLQTDDGRGRWFSVGTSVSSTNKTHCHDITEILLKVVLNTPVASHWQPLSHNVVSSTPYHAGFKLTI
jgi:hypothetical protein